MRLFAAYAVVGMVADVCYFATARAARRRAAQDRASGVFDAAGVVSCRATLAPGARPIHEITIYEECAEGRLLPVDAIRVVAHEFDKEVRCRSSLAT